MQGVSFTVFVEVAVSQQMTFDREGHRTANRFRVKLHPADNLAVVPLGKAYGHCDHFLAGSIVIIVDAYFLLCIPIQGVRVELSENAY